MSQKPHPIIVYYYLPQFVDVTFGGSLLSKVTVYYLLQQSTTATILLVNLNTILFKATGLLVGSCIKLKVKEKTNMYSNNTNYIPIYNLH